MKRARREFIFAALAGALAGVLGALVLTWSPPSSAQEVINPPSSNVQGKPVCGTSPAANDIFSFTGSAWCGTSTPTASSLTLSGATALTLSANNPVVDMSGFTTLHFEDNAGAEELFRIGSAGNVALKNLNVQGGITYALNNVTDVTNSYAPRMTVRLDATLGANGTSNQEYDGVPLTAPVTLDAIVYSSYGWTTCTTAPQFQIITLPWTGSACTGSPTDLLPVPFSPSKASPQFAVQLTPSTSSIAANTCVALQVANSGTGCSGAVQVTAVQITYHMQ